MAKFNSQSVEALGLLKLTMVAAGYSKSSLTAYLREIRFICAYYPDLSPAEWTDRHIIDYMAYLHSVHHASYSKCRMTAQSMAFFFRHVLKRPCDVPSKLYPKREHKLSRYAHKVAISNHRILEAGDQTVKFQYKDYSDHNKVKQMPLPIAEFIRRFSQHILPGGFVKMRHYGILGNSGRKKRVNDILLKMRLPQHPPTVKIPYQLRMLEKYGSDVNICPKCSQGLLVLIEKVYPGNRGSPFAFINQADMEYE